MVIGIAVVVAVCLVIALVVLLKARGKTKDAVQVPATAPSQVASDLNALAGKTIAERGPLPPAEPIAVAPAKAPVVMELPETAAPSGPYERVSCSTSLGVHGAMPPFGTLSFAGGILVFEATSRVVTKASAVGSDGSATLQSLGAVERGSYRFEIPIDTVQRIDMKGSTASVFCDDGQFEFQALGNAGPKLRAWLTAQGLEPS